MKKLTYTILLILLILFACKREKRHADLTGIDFNIKINRFDSAFWMLDTTDIASEFTNIYTIIGGSFMLRDGFIPRSMWWSV